MRLLRRDLSKRESVVVLVGLTLGILIVAWFFTIPLLEKRGLVAESVDVKSNLLRRYKKAIEEIPSLEAKRKTLKETIDRLEGSLLNERSPNLASAKLQTIIKKLAEKYGVKIKNVKSLKAEERGEYIETSVEITFGSDIRSLLNLLYDIENHPRAIAVTQLDIRLQDNRGSRGLKTTLRVMGAMKGGKSSLSPGGRGLG